MLPCLEDGPSVLYASCNLIDAYIITHLGKVSTINTNTIPEAALTWS